MGTTCNPFGSPWWNAARRISLGVVTASLLLAVGQAWGLSKEEIEQKALLIAGSLRCPTCQGVSVKDSNAPLARQIHDKVRRMVAEGQSGEAIRAFFVSRYGEWVLRAPKKEGLGLVLWLLPGLAMLLAGGMIGYFLMANHRERAAASPEPTPILTDAQRSRIASDIKTFEEQE